MNLKKRFLILCAIVISTVVFSVMMLSECIILVPVSVQVEGWGRNVSRDVRHYINETSMPHIFPKNFCSDPSLLLAMVSTRPSSFEARRAIRETWGQKRDNVTFFFLLGEVQNNSVVQAEIEFESRRYGDIIQERFIDSYNNLTLKSINMLKLFNAHCSNSYRYLMKVDDDIFVNIEKIVELLLDRNSTTDVLMGKIISDTTPFRETNSKWYAPYEWYPEEKYPDYLCGPSYIMSTDVVQKLYRCALDTPLFYIEDVYVTGICAKKVNVTPQHNSLFTCNNLGKDICLHMDVLTLHYFTPDAIRESFKILKNNSCPPDLPKRKSFFSYLWG